VGAVVTRPDDLLLRVKGLGRRAGLELRRYNATNALDAMRTVQLARREVDLVLDGGANAGQWAAGVRVGGYIGPLVSFEPLRDAHARLVARAARDPRWEARRLALDDHDGEAELHVAGNSWSSSLLDMADRHLETAPESAYVATETVAVARLDGVVLPDAGRIALKLDVQGAELRALRGAEGLLDRVVLVELELSLRELYVGGPLWPEIQDWLGERGYRLAGVEQSLVDHASGELLQANALFAR
jgi:FkbM family methyltransferase